MRFPAKLRVNGISLLLFFLVRFPLSADRETMGFEADVDIFSFKIRYFSFDCQSAVGFGYFDVNRMQEFRLGFEPVVGIMVKGPAVSTEDLICPSFNFLVHFVDSLK